MAYQEISFWDVRSWRNYRGGQGPPISVVDWRTFPTPHPPRRMSGTPTPSGGTSVFIPVGAGLGQQRLVLDRTPGSCVQRNLPLRLRT